MAIPEQEEKSTLKLARRIIDAVLQSPCVVETRCFSQPDEVDRLEVQVAAMLPSLAEKQEEIEKLRAALQAYVKFSDAAMNNEVAENWPRDPANGRFLCAPDRLKPKDARGLWSHTNAHEYGDGCFDGCCADYRCDDCGETWRAELPQ